MSKAIEQDARSAAVSSMIHHDLALRNTGLWAGAVRLYHHVTSAQYAYVAWHLRRFEEKEDGPATELSWYLKILDRCTEHQAQAGATRFCPFPPRPPDGSVHTTAPMEEFMWRHQ